MQHRTANKGNIAKSGRHSYRRNEVHDCAKMPKEKVPAFLRLYLALAKHCGSQQAAAAEIGCSTQIATDLRRGNLTAAMGRRILAAYNAISTKKGARNG